MTPTTVDAKIVAAAANAGHWAELAGGGQVTEPIFDARIEELTELLEPGPRDRSSTRCSSTRTCGSCSSAESAWCRRPVSRARRSTASSSSAGIPDLEEAVALIDELNGDRHQLTSCSSPGTVEQIKSVIKIAAEVPDRDVIVHIEGGRAGGHHSWEDLDDLLVVDLRRPPQVRQHHRLRRRRHRHARARRRVPVRPVGRAVRLPDHAGRRHPRRHRRDGRPSRPPRRPRSSSCSSRPPARITWVGAGKAQGGMTSGRSQLGADIHEIDNTASRCGRLLDEVAGDADAVAERRDEIVAAMADTAKPYFGDVADMTYLQWLQRYVELAIGDGDSTADTERPARRGSTSAGATASRRCSSAPRPGCTRGLRPDRDACTASTPKAKRCWRIRRRAIAALLSRYPDARDRQAAPGRRPVLHRRCARRSGKPVQLRAR